MTTTIALDYLIPELRVKIGDISEPYRYVDQWLLVALKLAAKKFQKYNKSKYLINSLDELYRNPYSNMFTTEETDGVIEPSDEYILIIFAALITLEGSLESAAWSTVSWKDAEISFSNLESGRLRSGNLERLAKEIDDLLLAPVRRLAVPTKQSLPGYVGNDYEWTGEL